MRYDPFSRGRHPVGVRTLELDDGARERRLPVELFYPAAEVHRGADLDARSWDRYELLPGISRSSQRAVRDAAPRAEEAALVVFSHGWGGHRRQSTFLCTHLASHGYVVAAPDHPGNTAADLVAALMGKTPREPGRVALERVMADRPADVGLVTERLLGGNAAELGLALRPDRVVLAGHSFGGWTALAAAPGEPRAAAVLALAPAGGDGTPLGPRARELLELPFPRPIPTLVVAAAHDSILPIAGVRGLACELAEPKRLVVIAGADHLHFCDDAAKNHELFRSLPPGAFVPLAGAMAPFSELLAEEPAHDLVRALALAHLDAHLGDRPEAIAFLAGDLVEVLGARGAAVELG